MTPRNVKSSDSERFSSTPISSIVIITAIESQALSLVKRFHLTGDTSLFPGGVPWIRYHGTYKDLCINLIWSGNDLALGVDSVGTVSASLVAYASIQALKPDLIINAGTAGGFKSKGAGIGDVFIASYVAFYDRRNPLPAAKHINRTDRSREPRPETRCGCGANLKCKYAKDRSKCTVTEFNDDRNHALTPFNYQHFVKKNHHFPEEDMLRTLDMRLSGITTSEAFNYICVEKGGSDNVPYLYSDLRNSLASERIRLSRGTDAYRALAYMESKLAADPAFFYDHGVDEEKRLNRLIWMDGPCRANYADFDARRFTKL